MLWYSPWMFQYGGAYRPRRGGVQELLSSLSPPSLSLSLSLSPTSYMQHVIIICCLDAFYPFPATFWQRYSACTYAFCSFMYVDMNLNSRPFKARHVRQTHLAPWITTIRKYAFTYTLCEQRQPLPNPKQLIREVFWRICVAFVMLNSILNHSNIG